MARVEKHCAEKSLRLTKSRRRVLELLLSEHKALGAYDILAQLAAEGWNAQPPVAYRALDFLVKNGFAHKLERVNAYVACINPDADHLPSFMICRDCDAVAEARSPAHARAFKAAAEAAGFEIEKTVLEAQGLCPSCQSAENETQR
ncbi:ABC transporter ATP-binding protein [Litoreibacter roseus]|uniref:ABC transporter ATP-binding protein n=2 Tax=Litoreibacter roseus TaxID=2601869 RepID=A0A6N6JH32_9RHOB|nr:ABC transporter ATP-binding protein [Litoreibacter roseus]